MKLVIAHNRYRQSGGEDVVFSRESALLRSAGHDVVEYVRENNDFLDCGALNVVRLGIRTVWAWDSTRQLRSILHKERPDLVHFHNTFPLISPAAYYTCAQAGVPVVQSLHSSRVLCPAATLYREGRPCEDCLARSVPWPGVFHGCYHNSRSQTAVVAGMTAVHRLLGTFREKVDAYIAFTEYSRRKFIAAGLPAERVFLKPHFLNQDPGAKEGPGKYALFLGRLVQAKGVLTLLKAWQKLKHIPLRIAGAGPLESQVHKLAQQHQSVTLLPHLSQRECFELIKGAQFLVWPSEVSFETFGLVAIEAFACGTPVVASRAAAIQELVEDRKTGLLFEMGNSDDLAAKTEWAWSHPTEMAAMGWAGRAEYKLKYTAERNYQLLMEIYRRTQNRTTWKAA